MAAILLVTFNACREDDLVTENEEEEEIVDLTDYSDWTDATHSKSAELNYDVVFNQNEVLRFDIEISSSDWSAMQSDLSSILGSSSGRPGQTSSTSDPMYVPCSFKFDDTEWYHVGIRYKGNSSLKTPYSSGIKKFSVKIDFDEFEDDYPAIENQRFYGFKQLNLKNNYDDKSFVREKVASDLFADFGLVSPKTSFCQLFVDYGDGPVYFGLYTLVEEVDDTLIKTQFESDGIIQGFVNFVVAFASDLLIPTMVIMFMVAAVNCFESKLATSDDKANRSTPDVGLSNRCTIPGRIRGSSPTSSNRTPGNALRSHLVRVGSLSPVCGPGCTKRPEGLLIIRNSSSSAITVGSSDVSIYRDTLTKKGGCGRNRTFDLCLIRTAFYH